MYKKVAYEKYVQVSRPPLLADALPPMLSKACFLFTS